MKTKVKFITPVPFVPLKMTNGKNSDDLVIVSLEQLVEAQNKSAQALDVYRGKLIKQLDKYKCDFNWDFEKDKPKHKSYIALDKVLTLIKEEI